MPRKSKSKATKNVLLNVIVEWEHFCFVNLPVDVTDEELKEIASLIVHYHGPLDSNEGPTVQQCWLDEDDRVVAAPEFAAKRNRRKITVVEVERDKEGMKPVEVE